MEHLDEEAKNELADIKAELEAQANKTKITPPAGAPPIKVENYIKSWWCNVCITTNISNRYVK